MRRPPHPRPSSRGTSPPAAGPREADLPELLVRLAQLGRHVDALDGANDTARASDLALEATQLYLRMHRMRLQLQQRTLKLQAADLLRSSEYSALSREIEANRRALVEVQKIRTRLREHLAR